MLPILISLLIPILLGYFIVHNLSSTINLNLIGKISLGSGLGFGISSCIFFICLTLFGPSIQIIKFVEIVLLIILTYFYLRRKGKCDCHCERPTGAWQSQDMEIPTLCSINTPQDDKIREKPHKILSLIFYLQIFISLSCFLLLATIYMHGNWDSWLIWNLHAKFLYAGGMFWKDYFNSDLNWTHPDYPLLIPALISRCWYYINNSNLLIPQFVALIFAFLTTGLLYSSLSSLKNKNYGYLAGIILLGTPFFILSANSLCADIPLSFFFLATIVLLFFAEKSIKSHNLLISAGICAGLAAWCKNEGLLFLIAVLIAQTIVISYRQGIKTCLNRLKFFLIGLMPVLLIIIYFKTQIAPSNDLFLGQDWNSIQHNISDFSRYKLILNYSILSFNSFTMGLIGPLILIVCSIIAGIKLKNEYSETIKTYLITITIILIGYFIIYLITPHNLEWHLSNSINRLFIQLWPSFIFACFMMVNYGHAEIEKS